MTSSSSSELRKTRVAGVSLILGVIALLVSAAISPGCMFVDSVARTELPEYIDALVDNATLAHVASLLAILGVLLLINLVISQHIYTIDKNLILTVNGAILTIATISYLVFGAEMYWGRDEFVADAAST